jgi:hypothetical protein
MIHRDKLHDLTQKVASINGKETAVSPDLEVVQIRRGESFKAWSH